MLFAIINSFHSLQLQHPFNVLILQALHIGATLSATLPTLHSIDIHSVIFKVHRADISPFSF
jgi:hypothetical protein